MRRLSGFKIIHQGNEIIMYRNRDRKYFYLNTSASEVFRNWTDGMRKEEIVELLSKKYGLSKRKALLCVDKVLNKIVPV